MTSGRIHLANSGDDVTCWVHHVQSETMETTMATLTVGTRSYEVSEGRVRRQSERMFTMSAERRTHRLDRAKTQLARSARDSDSAGATAAAKKAAAILLSQGITKI